MPEKKFIIIMVIFFCTIAFLSFMLSPFFAIRDYEITGNNYFSPERAVVVVEPYLEQNIWTINPNQIEQRLEQISYINQASVNRSLPAGLAIELKEREPIALINGDNNYFLFSSSGYILADDVQPEEIKLPVIEGMGYIFSGPRIIFHSNLEKIVNILANRSEQFRQQINVIQTSDSGDLYLILDNEIRVIMGEFEQLDYKMQMLDSVLAEVEEKNLAVDYIDLSIVNRPVIKEQ